MSLGVCVLVAEGLDVGVSNYLLRFQLWTCALGNVNMCMSIFMYTCSVFMFMFMFMCVGCVVSMYVSMTPSLEFND